MTDKGSSEETGGDGEIKDGGDAKKATGNFLKILLIEELRKS